MYARVEAGSNTSTVALRVVRGDERKPGAWGYNWATLFLRDINMGTWPSRLVSLESETVKYGHESRGTRTQGWLDSDLRMTALARTSSSCKRQTCPLVREGALHHQTHNCPVTGSNPTLKMSDVNEHRTGSAIFREILMYQVSWKSVQCDSLIASRVPDRQTD
jgi:hypothetical protein